MKIGICTGLDHAEEMMDCGFDYFECPVNEIGEMPYEDYGILLEKIKELRINVYSGNCFFPWESRLVGKNADMNKTEQYAARALKRLADLGCRVGVIGNGGARDPDEGMSLEDTYGEFADIIRRVAGIAGQYGIDIAIEALYYGESKICNTLAETAAFVRKIGMENVGMTADYYHFKRNGEDIRSLEKAADVLRHIHIAALEGRKYPMSTEESDYKEIFRVLKKIGYQGRISIEGEPYADKKEDGKKAAAVLRELIAF